MQIKKLYEFFTFYKNFLFEKIFSGDSLHYQFTVFLAILFFKAMGFFTKTLFLKFYLTVGFLVILFSFQDKIISLLFNNLVVQLFLFSALSLENFLLSSPLWTFVFFSCLSYSILDILDLEELVFQLSFLFFFFFFYSNFRNLIFKEEFIQNGHPLYELKSSGNLTWEKISQSFDIFLMRVYKLNFNSALPMRLKKTSFPFIAKRYMWKRFLNHVETYEKAYKIIFNGATVSGIFLGAVSVFDYRSTQAKTNRINAEAKAKIDLINAEAKAKADVINAEASKIRAEADVINAEATTFKLHIDRATLFKELGKKKEASEIIENLGRKYPLVNPSSSILASTQKESPLNDYSKIIAKSLSGEPTTFLASFSMYAKAIVASIF